MKRKIIIAGKTMEIILIWLDIEFPDFYLVKDPGKIILIQTYDPKTFGKMLEKIQTFGKILEKIQIQTAFLS